MTDGWDGWDAMTVTVNKGEVVMPREAGYLARRFRGLHSRGSAQPIPTVIPCSDRQLHFGHTITEHGIVYKMQ